MPGSQKKSARVRLAVMDMLEAVSLRGDACTAGRILFDKFPRHAPSGRGLDQVRKSEIWAGLRARDRRTSRARKYTLLSRRRTHAGWQEAFERRCLSANKRLNTAYVLKESFGSCGATSARDGPRRFFENWCAASVQRLKP